MKRMKRLFSLFAAMATLLTAGATDGLPSYPETLRDSILAQLTGASRPAKEISILKFGARPDGVSDCRPAFEKAMRRADKEGGLTISVPAGEYFMQGPLTLTSNVTINLDSGAVLRFTPDPERYPGVSTSWEGTYLYNYSPMIYGRGLKNVAITGRGTIDGNASTTFATWKPRQREALLRSREMNHNHTPVEERRFGEGSWLRPQLVQLYECSGVTLEGVKIINSPFWCVHLLRSENVVCRGLRYDAKLVNNDGIDPESSRNVLIEEVEFDNGDDNVAIKSGRDDDGRLTAAPSENIVIRRCHFKGLHAVVIGSEMSGGVRNVFVEDCDYAGYCKRGIYVKTNPDRGGYVKGLYVRNCAFDTVEDLFYVTSKYAGEGLESTHFSEISDIVVDGLSCREATGAALVVQGTEQLPVSRVSFDNIRVGSAKTGISFTDTCPVMLGTCAIGPSADIPTQVTAADNIFR